MANDGKSQAATRGDANASGSDEPESEQIPIDREPFRFAGYLGAVAAAIACSLGVLCFKLLPIEDNLQEKSKVCMLRGALTMLFSYLSIRYRGLSFGIAKGEYLVNLFRSLMGAFDMFLTYVALKYISISECTAIIYLSPIWTCLLGAIFLREPIKISLLLALPVSLLGMVLLSKPELLVKWQLEQLEADAKELNADYLQGRWPGIAAALGVGLLLAMVTILLKFTRKTPIETCTFYLGLAMVLLGVIVQLIIGFGSIPADLKEWSLHLCIGLVTYLTQTLFQWGLKFVPAGTYSVVRTLDIAVGFALGALFLNDLILWTSVAGSILIILVVVLLVLDNYLVKKVKSVFQFEQIDLVERRAEAGVAEERRDLKLVSSSEV